MLVPSKSLKLFVTRTLIVSPWHTLIVGPGNCLFIVIMGRDKPLAGTQSLFAQLVMFTGQFKQALLNTLYHSIFQLNWHSIGRVLSLQGLSQAFEFSFVCGSSFKKVTNQLKARSHAFDLQIVI